jgi:hypothetical protein
MATTGDAAIDRLLRALHELGDDRANRLVDAAWSRAEQEVSDALVETMRAVLLRRAAERLEAGDTAPDADLPPAAPASGGGGGGEPQVERPAEREVTVLRQPPAPVLDDAPVDVEVVTGGALQEQLDQAPEEPADDLAADVEASQDEDDEGWYLYGIVRAGAVEPGVPGVDPRREVVAVEQGAVAAIAGPVSLRDFAPEALRERLQDREWMAERVFAHEAVLARHLNAGPVVPMRFATVVTDEAAVHQFLDELEADLLHALEVLDGRSEWGVKLYADWAAVRKATTARTASEATEEGGEGAAYFSRKRSLRTARSRSQELGHRIARASYEELADVAVRAALLALREPDEGEPEGQSMLLNGAFLVDDEALDDFHDLAERLGRDHAATGIRVEVTGPWPPYSFVDMADLQATG